MAKKSINVTSKALRFYWKPSGVVNERNAESLRSWLDKYAGGVDIATFIHSSAYTRKHAKALSDLTD